LEAGKARHERWGLVVMRTLASITKAATDAFAYSSDASALTGGGAEPYDRIVPNGLARGISVAKQTNRSLFADIEVKANFHHAPLRATMLQLDGTVVANAYSFQRRLLGLPTGIREGVILLSAAWEPRLMPWLCHRLQDFTTFDLASFRVAGFGLAQAVPTQLTLRNRVMTAIMRARNAQEVMVLDGQCGQLPEPLDGSMPQAAKHDTEFRFLSGDASNHAAWRNSVVGKMPFRRSFDRIASIERLVATQSRPYQASLTHRDGHLMSLARGFVEDDVAFVAYQLTHRTDGDTNPALMLHAFLVQQLTSGGARYLAFIGDCAGPLRDHCEPVPAADLLMVRNTRTARLKQRAQILAQPGSRVAQLSRKLAAAWETRILG
jgi:hypothetical protein